MRSFVLSLLSCLGEVPGPSRALLSLRLGLDGQHGLGARRFARARHLRLGRLRRLEVRAVERLRTAATSTGCDAPAGGFTPGAVLIDFVPGTTRQPHAAIGVESETTERAPAQTGSRGAPPPASAGATLMRPGSSAFWTILGVLVGLVLILVTALDNVGRGPRHRYRGGSRGRR